MTLYKHSFGIQTSFLQHITIEEEEKKIKHQKRKATWPRGRYLLTVEQSVLMI